MKLFLLLLLFIPQLTFSQCNESISTKLSEMESIPYLLVDRNTCAFQPGKSFYISIKSIKYNTKYKFIFLLENLTNPVDVSIITLNKQVLKSKKITNEDNSINVIFKKTETYFLTINTKPEANPETIGCIGFATLERTSKRRYQKLRWKK